MANSNLYLVPGALWLLTKQSKNATYLDGGLTNLCWAQDPIALAKAYLETSPAI